MRVRHILQSGDRCLRHGMHRTGKEWRLRRRLITPPIHQCHDKFRARPKIVPGKLRIGESIFSSYRFFFFYAVLFQFCSERPRGTFFPY